MIRPIARKAISSKTGMFLIGAISILIPVGIGAYTIEEYYFGGGYEPSCDRFAPEDYPLLLVPIANALESRSFSLRDGLDLYLCRETLGSMIEDRVSKVNGEIDSIVNVIRMMDYESDMGSYLDRRADCQFITQDELVLPFGSGWSWTWTIFGGYSLNGIRKPAASILVRNMQLYLDLRNDGMFQEMRDLSCRQRELGGHSRAPHGKLSFDLMKCIDDCKRIGGFGLATCFQSCDDNSEAARDAHIQADIEESVQLFVDTLAAKSADMSLDEYRRRLEQEDARLRKEISTLRSELRANLVRAYESRFQEIQTALRELDEEADAATDETR